MLRNVFLEYSMHLIKYKLISILLTVHLISMQLMVTMHCLQILENSLI